MVINPIVGVYIPIIRIPIKGGMTIPNIATFDHGTNGRPSPIPKSIQECWSLSKTLSQENTIQRRHWCSLEQLISSLCLQFHSNLLNSFGRKNSSLCTHTCRIRMCIELIFGPRCWFMFLLLGARLIKMSETWFAVSCKDSSTMMLQDILAWKSSARITTMCWCPSRNGPLLFMAL